MRRLAVAYAVLLAILGAAAAYAIEAGRETEPATAVAGVYEAESPCISERFTIVQSGEFLDAAGAGGSGGSLRLRGDRISGDVTCLDGSSGRAALTVEGAGEDAALSGALAGSRFAARFVDDVPDPGARRAPGERSGEETFGRLMLAIAAVILAARLLGAAVARLGQPRVMGEVLAGILLGPTLLGAVAPSAQEYLFPSDIVPLLTAAASIGLAFYMFLVGLEIDPRMLRAWAGQAALISSASIAVPLALGLLAAVPVFRLLAPQVDFVPFALFMGVAMSVTAFPVLARILVERRMLRRPVGALTMASAAIDDVTAWGLLALATAVAASGSGTTAVRVVALAALFSAVMLVVGRRLFGRVARAYDEVGNIPPAWVGTIFVGILLSTYVAQEIGIAPIFGAFIFGLIMPRRADLTQDVTRRIEEFVVTLLLPLFFVVTGLNTQIGLLDRPSLWLLTVALIGVAIAGKWLGAMAAARWGGFRLRDAAAIGALMNTRGLTELIVLNIGLELDVISPALFTMLVIMALVTTFMAGPALRLLDPSGRHSAPPGEDLRAAVRPSAERSILVCALDGKNLYSLLALAEPLARSEPPRRLVLARLLVPQRLVTGVAREDRELERATEELVERRRGLLSRGLAVQAVAFTSTNVADDVLHLAERDETDLVLVDGRRPLLAGGVPRGDVGALLARAACDVAVLVERQRAPEIGPDHPVLVPFGGAEHDWAALELGSWIATAYEAPLKLLGARADLRAGRPDASRLLANASLVVQQLAGVAAEPVLVDPAHGVVEAAEGAGILVVGLSEDWRREGLGPVRSELANRASASTLFVRRGTRAGVLAPRGTDVTRFAWSRAGQPV